MTLIIRTPSIIQQRIILIVFFLVISALVWWHNPGDSINHPVQKFSKTPVPDVAQLDFTNAEDSWSSLTIDPRGNLKIDRRTKSGLADAIALLDDQNPEPQKVRMALLLEKQFGPKTSQQIMELVPILKDYQEVEQRWWAENGNSNPPPYADLFQLQDELLGEALAKKLFSKERRLAKMMLATQRIRNDTSLTQAQKDQRLEDLQKAFQDGSPHE